MQIAVEKTAFVDDFLTQARYDFKGHPWVIRFLTGFKMRGIKASTMQNYMKELRTIILKNHVDYKDDSQAQLLKKLAAIQSQCEPSYYMNVVVISKAALKFLNRHKIAEELPYPKLPDRKDKIRMKLLTPEERRKLIAKAPTLEDRLLIELLDETRARVGEIRTLQIKSIQFESVNDKMTAIITLTGKTGTRRRRVYESVPDLRNYLNDHPLHDNPDAPLFFSTWGKKYRYYSRSALWERIHKLGQSILNRPLHPHMFRHTGATEDSRMFTDREMMLLNGWNSAETVSIYSHLSMRDVDDKDLIVHGLRSKEEVLRPIAQVQVCGKCQAENAPVAMYCGKCGQVLGDNSLQAELVAQNKEFAQRIKTLEGRFETMLKTTISAR